MTHCIHLLPLLDKLLTSKDELDGEWVNINQARDIKSLRNKLSEVKNNLDLLKQEVENTRVTLEDERKIWPSDYKAVKELLGEEYDDKYIKEISSLGRIKEFQANILGLHDISPLKNLTGLTTLSINFNRIIDLSPLENLTNLLSLILGRTKSLIFHH